MLRYNEISLRAGANLQETEEFIDKLQNARRDLVRNGLTTKDEVSRIRDIADFRSKTKGTRLGDFLMSLPEYPEVMDDLTTSDENILRKTMFGRCRQFIIKR